MENNVPKQRGEVETNMKGEQQGVQNGLGIAFSTILF